MYKTGAGRNRKKIGRIDRKKKELALKSGDFTPLRAILMQ
jgi:hypothetical protein